MSTFFQGKTAADAIDLTISLLLRLFSTVLNGERRRLVQIYWL